MLKDDKQRKKFVITSHFLSFLIKKFFKAQFKHVIKDVRYPEDEELPYMEYMGVCRAKGCGLQPFWS